MTARSITRDLRLCMAVAFVFALMVIAVHGTQYIMNQVENFESKSALNQAKQRTDHCFAAYDECVESGTNDDLFEYLRPVSVLVACVWFSLVFNIGMFYYFLSVVCFLSCIHCVSNSLPFLAGSFVGTL